MTTTGYPEFETLQEKCIYNRNGRGAETVDGDGVAEWSRNGRGGGRDTKEKGKGRREGRKGGFNNEKRGTTNAEGRMYPYPYPTRRERVRGLYVKTCKN